MRRFYPSNFLTNEVLFLKFGDSKYVSYTLKDWKVSVTTNRNRVIAVRK